MDQVTPLTGYWDEWAKHHSFWGKAATITWCEHKYTTSYYVAEFQNAFTSLFIAAGGLLGLWWAIRNGFQRSFQLFTILVMCVGLGSFAFHATLLYYAQMLDELPMGIVMMCYLHILLDLLKKLWAHKARWVVNTLRSSNNSTDSNLNAGFLFANPENNNNNNVSINSNNDSYANTTADTTPLLFTNHQQQQDGSGDNTNNTPTTEQMKFVLQNLPLFIRESSLLNVNTIDGDVTKQNQILKQNAEIQLDYLRQMWSTTPFYYLCLGISKIPLIGPLIIKIPSPVVLFCVITLLCCIHIIMGFVLVFQTFFGCAAVISGLSAIELPLQYTMSHQNGHLPDQENGEEQQQQNNDNNTNNVDDGKKKFDHTMSRFAYWRFVYIGIFLLAFACWLIDNAFCNTLLKSPIYISFHGLWHFFNYVSTYTGIILAGYAIEMSKNIIVDDVEFVTKVLTPPKAAVENGQEEKTTTSLLLLTPNEYYSSTNDSKNDNSNIPKWDIAGLKLKYNVVQERPLLCDCIITPLTPWVDVPHTYDPYDTSTSSRDLL